MPMAEGNLRRNHTVRILRLNDVRKGLTICKPAKPVAKGRGARKAAKPKPMYQKTYLLHLFCKRIVILFQPRVLYFQVRKIPTLVENGPWVESLSAQSLGPAVLFQL